MVLDVPEKDSTAVAFGFLLTGTGKLWVSEMALEVVEKSIPVTGDGMGGYSQPDEPVNLDFK